MGFSLHTMHGVNRIRLLNTPRIRGALAIAMVLASCNDTPTRQPPPGLPNLTTQAAFAAVDSQARTARAPEAVPTWLALAIPGFGGFGFDTANGDLVTWVKDLRRGPEARAAVQHYLRTNYRGQGGRAGPNPPVRIQRGDYDFLELGSLRDRVDVALANEPGMQSLGISFFDNRVAVDVDSASVDRVIATLSGAGVPLAAVRVRAGARLDAPHGFPVR
jgi:hypothetical protein